MSGETAFRSEELSVPEVTSDAVFPITEKVHSADEMPPSLYQEAHKVPLVLELINGTSAYDHFDMKPLTNEIDHYIAEEINRRGLEDTKDDYQKVLNDAMNILGIKEGLDVYSMVEKIVRHFRIQHKLYTVLREKEELFAADPLSLSVPKFKKYLEIHHGY